jgi:hypothetical protein
MATMSFHFSYRFRTSLGIRASLLTRFRCSYISHMLKMYYTIYSMSMKGLLNKEKAKEERWIPVASRASAWIAHSQWIEKPNTRR